MPLKLVQREVVTVEVDMVCDKCNNGRMRPTGISLARNPPLYPHRCNMCDAHENYPLTYPCIEYRPKTDWQ